MEKITNFINVLIAIYICIPILTILFILFIYGFGRTISKETIDKLVDFGKWYMVAVAIVFAAKIVDASFTDRETSIKEMAIYEKYADNILEADNLEKRWKLSEYFAAVTPSKVLRERWVEYKKIIKPQYDQLIKLNKEQNEILSKTGTLSSKEMARITQIEKKKSALNVQLVSSTADQWVIVFTTDTNLPQAEFENTKLKKTGIQDAIIVQKDKLFFNVSRNYSSKAEATLDLNSFRNKVRADVYIRSSESFCLNKIQVENHFMCQ